MKLIPCCLVLLALSTFASAATPIVIAHRGASGYLPEHTLEAKALAHAMGADFLEQDLVLTKDDVPVVLHDIHLDTVTDVATRFPDRKRDDGRYYALDFTVAEIKQLRADRALQREDRAARSSRAASRRASRPSRFPRSRRNCSSSRG